MSKFFNETRTVRNPESAPATANVNIQDLGRCRCGQKKDLSWFHNIIRRCKQLWKPTARCVPAW
jgi:hypothetical protein